MHYNKHPYTDENGKIFESEKELLKYYNIAKTTFYRQLKKGKSIQEIINNYQRKNNATKDHNGKNFNTLTDMLKYYNVSDSVYRYGMQTGYDLQTILTKTRHNSVDHNGKKFKTFKEMCEYWDIPINSVKRRLKNGWTIEKALTEPLHRPMSLPTSLQHKYVKEIITNITYIKNNYFLCNINQHDIILSRNELIKLSNELIKERTKHELE